MKYYCIITQPFFHESKDLGEYLFSRNIKFRLGADFYSILDSVSATIDLGEVFSHSYTLLSDEDFITCAKLVFGNEIKFVNNLPRTLRMNNWVRRKIHAIVSLSGK